MWTDGLDGWFRDNGRHQLPWRKTTDPWAVMVSEVMLQQTSVARVLPRWQRFLQRWPSAASCAAAPLDDVLREWQGLGYPRRARALWLTAQAVADGGWPGTEEGLCALPGVGAYTARALLAFSGAGPSSPIPARDVNLGRVAARAALGAEPHQIGARRLDAVLAEARPVGMSMRDYTHALFDVGARHCRAQPLCDGCPLRQPCAMWTVRADAGSAIAVSSSPRPRRQPTYAGSLRQLRGAVLAASLRLRGADDATLVAALDGVPGATADRIGQALAGLRADGLLGDR